MEQPQNEQIITDTLANLEIPLSRLQELGGVFNGLYSHHGGAVSLLKEVRELEKQLPENKEAIEAKWSEITRIVTDVTDRLTNVIELMEEVNDKHKCWCGGELGLIQEASFSNGGYSNHLKCDKCGKHVVRYG